MTAPITTSLVAAVLAGTLAVSATARAAVPAPVGGEVQVGLPELPPEPACGTLQARLHLSAGWSQEGFFDLSLRRFEADGSVVDVATLRAPSAGGPAYLVCDENGAGVVLFGDGYNYDDDYRVTDWKLQWFDSAGTWIGQPRPLKAFALCSNPRVLSISADGDILALEACRVAENLLTPMLRRFPADGGVEPEPLRLREPTADWINDLRTATDGVGNRLVAWNEGFDDDGQGNLSWRIVARALGADGAVLGEPFRVDAFDPAQA